MAVNRRTLAAGLTVISTLMPVLAGAFSQDVTKIPRLDVKPAKIRCKTTEYDGLRGTLYVRQDRTISDSGIVELPVVVVKSLNHDPGHPVFQFTGGPGLSNIAQVQNISEENIKSHDVVIVGYRGVDGTPKIEHAVFDEIMKTPNVLSESSMKKIGRKISQAVKELAASGIDVGQYSIQNVVDDADAARAALGYEKINITGGSYGGAVVMAYCLRYPEKIHRAIMVEAAFPYDIAFGKPEEFDARLEHLNGHWKKDPEAAKRSADIVQTVRNVWKNMPQEHGGIPIDPSKVRIMTYFGVTNQRSYVSMIFEAYIRAENGDFADIAVMCMMYDQLMGQFGSVGDLLAKTYSSVTDPDRDFISELDDPASVVGSPLSMFAWGCFQHSDWPVRSIVTEHPLSQKSNVETLVFYGSKQTGQPLKNKHGASLTNARWVILDDIGHSDIWTIAGEGTSHLMRRFLDDGVVDTSKFGAVPNWDFTPEVTFSQMFKQMMQQGGAAR